MAEAQVGEFLDVVTKTGQQTGISKPRGLVHKDGDYHRAVHVWIYAENTGELLLQRRAECKDSWPGQWDISSAGHISAGDTSLVTARRELQEELGMTLPEEAFELLFVFLQECVINDGTYINNEFNDVYLVTTMDPVPLEAFTLQEAEVSAVKYISWKDYRDFLWKGDAAYVPYDVDGQYGQLFRIIEERFQMGTCRIPTSSAERCMQGHASTCMLDEVFKPLGTCRTTSWNSRRIEHTHASQLYEGKSALKLKEAEDRESYIVVRIFQYVL